MHPLRRYLVPFGITVAVISVIWLALAPVTKYLASFWPLAAVGIAIAAFIWAFAFVRIRNAVNQGLAIPMVRGALIALFLTAAYSFIVWLLLVEFPGWIQETLGVSGRAAWVVAATIGLLLIPVPGLIWRLYGVTGIPGDPKTISRAFRGLAFLILTFLGWWYHDQPNRFFNPKTGASEFWVAEKEGRAYPTPGYSPATGEELRQGTPADAERFRQESWLEKLLGGYSRTAEAPVATSAAQAEPVIIELLGEEALSEEIDLDRMAVSYPGWRYLFEGPETAVAVFDDRVEGPITENFGVKAGRVAFKGPPGETVTVRFLPPGS